MTKPEFIAECEKRLIDVNIALENESVENALIERNDPEVIKLLDSEF